MPRLRGTILNVPNIISTARIIAVPIFVFAMMAIDTKNPEARRNATAAMWACWIYTGACLSDLVDGYYARRYNIVSDLGKFLDPLADKLLNLAAIIMMIPLGWVPAWLVTLLIAREVTITTLRGAAASEGQQIIEASKWGKYKTAFGNVGTAALVMHYPFLGVRWDLIGWVCFVAFAAFSIGSGVHYCWSYFAHHARNKH